MTFHPYYIRRRRVSGCAARGLAVLLLTINAECRVQDAELNIGLLDFASVHHARDARTHTRNRARIIILIIQPFFRMRVNE